MQLSGRINISNNLTNGVNDNISIIEGFNITITDKLETENLIGVNFVNTGDSTDRSGVDYSSNM